MKTTKQLAKQYRTTDRTIRRWKHENAPLTDSKAMRTWLAARKNLPPRLVAGVPGEAVSAPVSVCPPPEIVISPPEPGDPVVLGAPGALGRAGQAEESAYRRMMELEGDPNGDPLARKQANVEWRARVTCLRQLDRSIEATRRDAGEWLSRLEAEGHVVLSERLQRIANAQAASNLSDGDTSFRTRIVETLDSARQMVIAAAQSRGDLPGWLAKCLLEPQSSVYRNAEATVAAIAADFASYVESGRAAVVCGLAEMKAELLRAETAFNQTLQAEKDSHQFRSEEYSRVKTWFQDRIAQGLSTVQEMTHWEERNLIAKEQAAPAPETAATTPTAPAPEAQP